MMTNEMHSIIRNLQNTNSGEPWFGRPVYDLLDDVDPAKAYLKPGNIAHSLIELIYHMLTWAEFTLKRIEGDKESDLEYAEKMDWRQLDPAIHTWEAGLSDFKKVNEKITELLSQKNDDFLNEKVDYRNYNFRFLLNGLIQHNIYHAGQVAYVSKLLK